MLARMSSILPIDTRGLWIGTFHGLCNRMLRAHHRDAGLPQSFQILDVTDQLAAIKRLMKANGVDDEKYPPRDVQRFINGAKEEGLRPDGVEAYDSHRRRLIEIYQLYEAQCQREGVVDFAELLLRAYELLSRNAPVREHYQRRFRHILVDEFQDTNTLQYKWLRLLAGGGAAIFAVGDDDQSIYAFRGANVGNMADFERDYAHGTVIRLEQNYRSYGHILDSANALIGHNSGRLGKNLWTEQGEGEPVRVIEQPSDGMEAQWVVDEIRSLIHEGSLRREIAVLYRSNAQSRVLEHAIFSAGIPYKVYGGLRFFERQEIKHALAYLRLMANPQDDTSLMRVVNFPTRGIGARTLETLADAARTHDISLYSAVAMVGGKGGSNLVQFAQLINRLIEETRDLPLPEMVEHMLEASGLNAHYKAEREGAERLENLNELITAAAVFASGGKLRRHARRRGAPDRCVFDADAGRGRRAHRRAGRHDAAGGLPVARGAGSRRQPGAAGPGRGPAHDGACRQGPGVRRGLHHRPGRGPVPAREQHPRTVRAGRGTAPDVRGDHARATAPVHHAGAEPHAAWTDALRHAFALPGRNPREAPEVADAQGRPGPGGRLAGVLGRQPHRRVRPQAHQHDCAASPRGVATGVTVGDKQYRVGQGVHHARFGDGTIIGLSGSGQDAQAEIQFRDVGAKTLALGIAKLDIVQG